MSDEAGDRADFFLPRGYVSRPEPKYVKDFTGGGQRRQPSHHPSILSVRHGNHTDADSANLLARGGRTHRQHFGRFVRAGGCIARSQKGIHVRGSGEIHRPQF